MPQSAPQSIFSAYQIDTRWLHDFVLPYWSYDRTHSGMFLEQWHIVDPHIRMSFRPKGSREICYVHGYTEAVTRVEHSNLYGSFWRVEYLCRNRNGTSHRGRGRFLFRTRRW